MGQNTSTVKEYTPDTKPPQNENSHSLEKPKNENEDIEQKERESEMAMQKKLGVNVIKKDSDMPMKMESFIIDTIIVEKLKHSGNRNDIPIEIARATHAKLIDQYGGYWGVITAKSWSPPESGYCISPINGTYIFLKYKQFVFTSLYLYDGFSSNGLSR